MTQPPPTPFDAQTTLPAGTNLIQASAGTGKTWSITTLVARLVAIDGLSLENILVVTFTRAATAELRDRVREGLVELYQAVDLSLRGQSVPVDPRLDALVPEIRSLKGGLTLGRKRLLTALAGFDQASIFTIHGFCRQTLQASTLETDLTPDVELVQNLDPLLAELVDDYWVRELHSTEPARIHMLKHYKVNRALLLKLARQIEQDPGIELCINLDPAIRETAHPEPLLQAQWNQALTALRAAWSAEGDDATQWLLDEFRAKQMTHSSYNSRQPKSRRAELEKWLERTDLDLLCFRRQPLPLCVSYFSSRRIAPAHLSGPPTVYTTLFEAADQVCAASHALSELFIHGMAQQIRIELPRIKERAALLSYTDLLQSVWTALKKPQTCSLLQQRMRDRYDVALIDEFQDTDPTQWEVFNALFGEGVQQADRPGPVFAMIGDPKQAIYGFRGADLQTYIGARQTARAGCYTLDTNHRSDAPLVAAVNQIFSQPDVFHHTEMPYFPVQSSADLGTARIRLEEQSMPAMAFLLADIDDVGKEGGSSVTKGIPGITADWTEHRLPDWIASDVVQFLSSDRQIWDKTSEGWIPVRPGHLAILLRANKSVQAMCRALQRVGVPAVSFSEESVLAIEISLTMEQLLEALESPRREGRARVVMTGPLVGLSAIELEALGDEEWEEWFERLIRWNEMWSRRGFMTTFRTLTEELGVLKRLLRQPAGERIMTDLRHLAELLHSAERTLGARPERLLRWFKEQRRNPERREGDVGKQRLESDSDAVQVMTVHKSKGLEFPVVWCPDLWKQVKPQTGALLRFHSPSHDNRRVLELSLDRTLAPRPENQDLLWVEEMQESLRLAYVALTRARHHCRIFCGRISGLNKSPLGNLLHPGIDMGGTQSRFHRVAERLKDRHPDDLAQDLRDIASESSGTIAVTRLPSPTVTQWRPTRPPDEAPLQIAQFDREALDTHWGRGSYSGLVRGLKRAPMVESPEAEGIDHADKGTEVDHTGTGLNSAPGTQPRQLPLANFPKGSRAGTCMHEILENHAFENPTELHEVVTEHLEKHGFEEGLADELCGGLREALRTPLGPQAGNIRLDQLRRKPVERLDELDFDLPVLGGTLSGDGSIGGPELARVLGDHAGDCPLLTADALARIETLPGTPLRGYLTGQIDLVFRVHGQEKWFLADYKSNWLGDPNTGRCEIEDYRPERVVQSMDKSLYVLQYHLYTVALHRLLRWRIPDYSYDRHLGGSLYLFLRGMMGPIGPRGADGCPHGVFFDRPPSARIEALDRLLAGAQP